MKCNICIVIFTSSVAVTILTMGLMSILKQSSPWWLESTSTCMGQWMKMAFMKVWIYIDISYSKF